jgi:propanediol dehydratase large subunit
MAIVVLEAVPGALREVLVDPLVAVQAANNPDVHGNSMALSASRVSQTARAVTAFSLSARYTFDQCGVKPKTPR